MVRLEPAWKVCLLVWLLCGCGSSLECPPGTAEVSVTNPEMAQNLMHAASTSGEVLGWFDITYEQLDLCASAGVVADSPFRLEIADGYIGDRVCYGTLEDGRVHGDYRCDYASFFGNGQPERRVSYLYGAIHGEGVFYMPDGSERDRMVWVGGVRTGAQSEAITECDSGEERFTEVERGTLRECITSGGSRFHGHVKKASGDVIAHLGSHERVDLDPSGRVLRFGGIRTKDTKKTGPWVHLDKEGKFAAFHVLRGGSKGWRTGQAKPPLKFIIEDSQVHLVGSEGNFVFHRRQQPKQQERSPTPSQPEETDTEGLRRCQEECLKEDSWSKNIGFEAQSGAHERFCTRMCVAAQM